MIEKIQKALKTAEFDAVVLTGELNRRYATGFHSTAGACCITRKSAHFFTDFRYAEAARAAIQGCEVHEMQRGQTYSGVVGDVLRADGVRCAGLEDESLTYADYKHWERGLRLPTKPMGGFLDALRTVKTPAEVDCIVRAQRIAERAYAEVLSDIRPGVSEKQIAARLTYLMLHYGAENMSFDPIVVSGVNSSKPHGVPSQKRIEAGDFVTMDFGCIVDGYCSDMTRTVAVGHCTEEMRNVYELVLRAQQAGIAAAHAGARGSEVDDAGRRVIEQAGYGDAFGHGFGHGVGLFIHEAPNASPAALTPLPAGAILTAEPGIYLPGRFGVRIEDMLLIEDGGSRDLTEAPKKLQILPA